MTKVSEKIPICTVLIKVNITLPFEDEKLNALEIFLKKENTGRVTGVFDADLDKCEFSALHIMDGWKTYRV